MEYITNKISKRGLSRIGFGGIPIQNEDISSALKTLKECQKRGINYIDSARGYKDSEKIIGEAIKGYRDHFFLATKSMAKTESDMERDINISLQNFQTDYIDLYQLHNPSREGYKMCMEDGGAYHALLKAKKEGKIGHIGITCHSLDLLEEVVESGKFESVMYPYNLVEVQGEEFFKKCKELGILTIAMKPLAGGALENRELAIKYLLNKDVDIILIGMRDYNEVIFNTSIKKESLSEKDEKEVNKIRDSLGSDFCRRCGYCAPCTKGIDIPNCFVFEGYFKRYNLKEWAVERYNSLKAHASDCIECGKCLTRCPYHLNIIEKLKEVRKTFGK